MTEESENQENEPVEEIVEESKEPTYSEIKDCMSCMEEMTQLDMARLFTNDPDNLCFNPAYEINAAFHKRFSSLGGMTPYIKDQLKVEKEAQEAEAAKAEKEAK